MSINLKRKPTEIVSPRRMMLLVLGLFIVLLVVPWLYLRKQNPSTLLLPPPDFQLAARVDLAARSYAGETVAQLSLVETAVVSIYYTLPSIDVAYFDLSLSGPNDKSFVILQSEDYRTDQHGGGTWGQSLSPGVYQLRLSALQTSGTLSVYWKYD